ncbi:MAG: phosphoglycerate dehydrogenase related dehydrogenase, partial [uncultured archaeon A07HR60]
MSASVVLTGTVLPDSNVEREIVDAAGGDLEIIDVESSAELIESATDPVGIMTIETPIDEAVLDAFPNLEFVSVHGIGVDMVDVDAATERGIPVFNTPEYCVEEVATHTLGLILACQRRICQFNADVKSGEWDYGAEGSIRRLSTKTVGVVGLGAIGVEVVDRLSGFDVDLIGYDPYVSAEEMRELGVRKVEFDELCGAADIVTVHTPLTDATQNLVDATAFDHMQTGVTLINAARGGIIDHAALEDALADGTVAHAGLDVLATEPPENDAIFSRDNLTVTPHAAWYSDDALGELQRTAAQNVAAYLED